MANPTGEIFMAIKNYRKRKETTTMQVTYNGVTGELMKLERKEIVYHAPIVERVVYDLSIYDSEKQVTHSFTGVKLEDVKFMGGEVSFNGYYTDGVAMSIEDIAKKANEGKTSNLKPEDIAAIAKNDSGLDMWPLVSLMLMFGFGSFGGGSSADYWRGKYDAYKELTTPIKEEKV